MIRLARAVCRERPTARRAIAHLRRHRTGLKPDPRERLAYRIAAAIRQFRAESDCGNVDVERALKDVLNEPASWTPRPP
jgi:hypothetical protein